MDIKALRTIKVYKHFTRAKCVRFAENYIRIISNKYPDGIASGYFVLPGFEHVTRKQPIIKYNGAEGEFQLSSISKFK